VTRIAVFGAGAIGCWVGGRLAAGGSDVTLIGRARVIGELAHGVKTSDTRGSVKTATPTVATDAGAVAGADLVLVTVKSAQTADAARELSPFLSAKAVVVSLQNGVRNVPVLRAALPEHTVLAGMVPFNVIRHAAGHYHRASAGSLMFDGVDAAAPLTEACLRADLPFELRDDMRGVQWSKLVMNLNNAINALSGIPLAKELGNGDFRRCLAAAQSEAIAMIRAAREPLARVSVLPTRLMPAALRLPDILFNILGRQMLAIDPSARSSMWDDLEAKRPTEIDYINGEIVALGKRLGRPTPVNQSLVDLIRAAEAGGNRGYSGRGLAAAIMLPTA
jgi:2-dehydropantoate 2-reductase